MEKIRNAWGWFKKSVTNIWKTAGVVLTNMEELAIAVSLLISIAYNYYDLTIRAVGKVEYTARLSAVVVAGLFALHLLVKHFNKKGR